MFIWRIENEDGEGIYRGSTGLFNIDEGSTMTSARHPCPIYDNGLGWTDIDSSERELWKFGFATLAQMRQWVYKSKWRIGLDQLGFSLVRYRVPDEFCRRSNFQAIFHSGHVERVEVRRVCYADKGGASGCLDG